MAIVRLDHAQLAYGDNPLLADVSFSIEKNDRIALIGRNGAGKSSLMRVLAKTEVLDAGEAVLDQGVTVSYLDQALPEPNDLDVFSYLVSGLAELGEALSQYESLAATTLDNKGLSQLQKLQDIIDAKQGWDLQQRVHRQLETLKLPQNTLMKSLSGGYRKRLSILRSLLPKPDLFLLDEPTNHLDIPAIMWLQEELKRYDGAIVLISHDRQFMTSVCDRVFWLDRGQLRQFKGGYTQFVAEKDHILQVEEQQNALFDKRLQEEEKWIRQGIKARRTRNEGRVRALKAMREERASRIDQKGLVNMEVSESKRSGKRVAELFDVGFSYEGKDIINHANLTVMRGDSIGIVGANGVGKSTLVKLILGQLTPTQGRIKLGTNLDVAYFDQNRQLLDDDKSVGDNLAEGRESIEINGKQKHVISYLADFLFTPQRVRSPVSTLSGGEKNRLLLAKIFSKPANILILDEPSNDLDIETLELLEELLADYKGTVLLISHDRQFLENIVSSTVFIDHKGNAHQYVGGYDDLCRQHGDLWPEPGDQPEKPVEAKPRVKQKPSTTKAKLSYKDQRELDALPGLIETAEEAIKALEQAMSSPAFFQQDQETVTNETNRLADLQKELEAYYDRWSELDAS